MKRVLAIVAHPDDEVLGLGGTLASIAANDVETVVAVVCEGVGTRRGDRSLTSVRDRTKYATSLLGVSRCLFGGYGVEGRLLADFPQGVAVKFVEEVMNDVQPSIVFTHALHDIHADHRRVSEAVMYVCRVFARPMLEEILLCEVLSSTEQQYGRDLYFQPNMFYDIHHYLEKKLAALEVYHDELGDFPHPRSREAVTALANFRGVQAGFNGAEAFELVRSRRRSEGGCAAVS
ncbi:PIG-L deacetylase family protein [Rathayibacter toxicus]|uniref:PIG-L deacetylase family protein n=1 Tax=Rathayibacter toxicus TaxID=145458 RepID=UPI001C043C09|nr:PIG-L deacetylase family protein [Rathayibacter toxicus]QWL30014.1 PIG-L family deacetylase [Rathayibacter toxicus]